MSVETTLDIPLRGKKAAPKRAVKADGSIIMTQNAFYSVKQLPSMPDRLRNSASDFRASLLTSPPCALALTHDHAYIWDYTSPVPVTHPRIFDVPRSSQPTESLPLGALVINGASPSVGLVVVSATGKVTFWENIDVAESLSLFQKKNIGVEGSVGTLFSGETVTDITSADHAGFILTLSSGRIAQISLRDTQGKPKVTAQFLRSNDAANSSGLFGGIKSVLGVGAWKRDVVGVRTRTLGSRGQMQVIAGTESAQLQVWDLAWSGQSTFKGSIDFKPLLQDQLATLGSAEKQVQVQLLDLAILPDRVQGDEVTIVGQAPPMDLLLLAQIGSQTTPDYVLVEVALVGKEARLERVTPARRDSNAEVHQMDERRPRLMLPNPGHTAFIVFEQKIMVVAIPPEDTSPEAQLLMESSRLQEAFQDTIHLRRAALINYIKKNYAPISRPTAWRLLQDAEKVAAALALWRQYDSGLQQASRGGAAPTWVRDTIMVLGIQAKRISPGAQKDIDTIREWFTFHVDEIDHLRNSAMNLVSHYYEDGRHHHLTRLSDIGQAGAGIAIAEKYRDLGTLCRLVVDESNFLIEAMNNAETDEVENRVIQEKMDELQHNVDRYFKIFGDEWATVFFDSHLTSHRSFGLLNEADSYREPLTRYLRADPARARLGWINEVLTEHSFEKADKALTQLAREQENNLWSKKVELSLGKLAAIAVAEENSSSNNPVALDEARMWEDFGFQGGSWVRDMQPFRTGFVAQLRCMVHYVKRDHWRFGSRDKTAYRGFRRSYGHREKPPPVQHRRPSHSLNGMKTSICITLIVCPTRLLYHPNWQRR
ncbi:hypothetical protein M8818_002238 [Zalaria obscura]|uniref:Uncharacterized protein n=1 Tax=Zalaria obscura TaxID=2024903 RepID=A0ACC3SMS3_9PEZI